jgi:hypothetical protein
VKVKEFGNLFGMTVTELSEFSGYTRVALYDIIEGNAMVNKRRYNALLAHLKERAWTERLEKERNAREEYDKRMESLDDLRSRERCYGGYERVV